MSLFISRLFRWFGMIWVCIRSELLVLVVLATISKFASAHDSRPLYIELVETAPQRYQLQWKIPPSIPLFSAPTVTLPEECDPQGERAEFSGPDGSVRRLSYACSTSLIGRAISITYPGPNPSVASLICYSTSAGERHLAVLGPQETSWIVPMGETVSGVARHYAALGMQHIWAGADHLLFVACLVWVAGTWRRLLITISGFTVAHSLTLGLSMLHIVQLPIPAVEAAIALSIVFLATEVAQGPRESLTWRHPIAVAGSFGLLHGFGFAAALQEIGLPRVELATGLLFFNVGVEIGQILFVAGVITLQLLSRLVFAKQIDLHEASLVRKLLAYAIGSVAICWLLKRCAAF